MPVYYYYSPLIVRFFCCVSTCKIKQERDREREELANIRLVMLRDDEGNIFNFIKKCISEWPGGLVGCELDY